MRARVIVLGLIALSASTLPGAPLTEKAKKYSRPLLVPAGERQELFEFLRDDLFPRCQIECNWETQSGPYANGSEQQRRHVQRHLRLQRRNNDVYRARFRTLLKDGTVTGWIYFEWREFKKDKARWRDWLPAAGRL